MLGAGERLVSLDIQVDLRFDGLRDFLHALGPAAMRAGSEARVIAARLAEFEDFLAVGGDQHIFLRQQRRRSDRFIDARDQGNARNLPQRLASHAGGTNASGNDGEDAHARSALN